MKKYCISLLLVMAILNADQVTKIEQRNTDLNLTIYNDNIAMITEERKIDYKKGPQQIIYENVPSAIILESVRPTFSSENMILYSQNYSFDTINFESIAKYYIGKKISYLNYSNRKVPCMLLSDSPLVILDYETNEVTTIIDQSKLFFPELPNGLSLKPFLSWSIHNVDNQNNGSIKLNYLSNGFSWQSNYTLSIGETNTLNGWITVTNNSGIDYPNANLTFLAGDINTIRKNLYKNMPLMDSREAAGGVMTMSAVMTPEVKETVFNDYYMYKIPFKETLKDKATKQISFMNKNNLKLNEIAQADLVSGYIYNTNIQPIIFSNIVEIDNSKENGLGISLPKGIVRVYKKENNEEHFVGESEINNISNNEKVSIKTSKIFDLKGEYKITKQDSNTSHTYYEKEVKLMNKSKEQINLRLNEIIQNGNSKITVTNTCEQSKKCVIKNIAKNVREININLNPNEEYVFTLTYNIIY